MVDVVEIDIKVNGYTRYKLQALPHNKREGFTDYHCMLTHIEYDSISYGEYVMRGSADVNDMVSIAARMLQEGHSKLEPVKDDV